ncbi:MAG: acetyl-CoA C-acetyltransferase [bacterium]|nr:acetyl-CoA C-acetyltransferase [bacterium]
MEDIYIVSAARTPVGTLLGSLSTVSSPKLGSLVIKEALQRGSVAPEWVDETIMGCVLQAGLAQGPGRQASIGAGIPESVPAWTVNQICGSGLKTVTLAAAMIKAGDASCIVAGGMENMTRAPHVGDFVRTVHKMGTVEMRDTMVYDGLTDAFSGKHMGLTAEAIAEKYGLTRLELDEFSAISHQKACQAIDEGAFKEEIVPVLIPQRKGDPILFDTDEHPRRGSTVEVLSKLRPSFKSDGVVTAGNASGVNDGAAAIIVASGAFVKEHNLKPMAKIISYATSALDPWYMGLGPIEATNKALKKAGWTVDDLERAELNEAFASQSLACLRDLKIRREIVNVHGGAIALGHPIGASGARILTTLLYELKHSGLTKGLATLCVGGGMGVAMLVEACK